ncbi:ATP-binding protein [Maricaulis sp.]|uniref:ATP-binding protein n=1 Tax=Maricaulis sp. TaxID=1486257 RepID=UPI002613D985|nr:ATP-binding protein [Maricaulis sp.]
MTIARDCIWIMITDMPQARALEEYLGREAGDRLLTGPGLPDGVSIGIVVADDAHRGALKAARLREADSFQSIFLTESPDAGVTADFVLPADADFHTLKSVVDAAQEFRDQIAALRSDVAGRQSAVGTIINGQFVLRTLDEARNLSTMLALACPNSDMVAVGLQELLINAVEHGNLEIDAALKQDLLLRGMWREEVERRLADPQYTDRRVIVSFRRGERMIALTIQDDGAGFDYKALEAEGPPARGYRGRGITLARTLSFSSVTYLGAGNMVEAIILIGPEARNAVVT